VLRWGRFLFGGEGGLVVCRWEELRLGRIRRNRGGEGQQRGHISTFFRRFHWRNTPSVILSAILTDLPFGIPQWFRQHFKWWTGHVTVRICHFESLSDSIGILKGEPVTSLYGVVVLNPSVISSVKITPPKPPCQRPAFF
jgi:hypothetical protein